MKNATKLSVWNNTRIVVSFMGHGTIIAFAVKIILTLELKCQAMKSMVKVEM